jgi:hypothetical protein
VDHERASYAGFFLRVAWLSGELYRIFFTLFFYLPRHWAERTHAKQAGGPEFASRASTEGAKDKTV